MGDDTSWTQSVTDLHVRGHEDTQMDFDELSIEASGSQMTTIIKFHGKFMLVFEKTFQDGLISDQWHSVLISFPWGITSFDEGLAINMNVYNVGDPMKMPKTSLYIGKDDEIWQKLTTTIKLERIIKEKIVTTTTNKERRDEIDREMTEILQTLSNLRLLLPTCDAAFFKQCQERRLRYRLRRKELWAFFNSTPWMLLLRHLFISMLRPPLDQGWRMVSLFGTTSVSGILWHCDSDVGYIHFT